MTLRVMGLTALLCLPLPSLARDCYYYWVHQCVEVVDASQRQLRQFVLISPGVNYLAVQDGQCDQAVAQAQEPVDQQLLDAFNRKADDIDACQTPIESLPARVYSQPHKATWHYNRGRKSREGKTVIPLEGLPMLSTSP